MTNEILIMADRIPYSIINTEIAYWTRQKKVSAYEKHKVQGSVIKRRNKAQETVFGRNTSMLVFWYDLKATKKTLSLWNISSCEKEVLNAKNILRQKTGNEIITASNGKWVLGHRV